MTVFEYLSVLVSIVLALGIAHILGGLSSIARSRGDVRLYWVVIVSALFLLGTHVQMWWGYWDQSVVVEWTLPKFAATLVGPVLLYTLTRLLMPDGGAAGLDLREHFSSLRVPFFLVLAALWGWGMIWRTINFGDPFLITRRIPQAMLFGLGGARSIEVKCPVAGIDRRAQPRHLAGTPGPLSTPARSRRAVIQRRAVAS